MSIRANIDGLSGMPGGRPQNALPKRSFSVDVMQVLGLRRRWQHEALPNRVMPTLPVCHCRPWSRSLPPWHGQILENRPYQLKLLPMCVNW